MYYLLAFVCGVFFGALVMALCVTAKRADQGLEEMVRRLEK